MPNLNVAGSPFATSISRGCSVMVGGDTVYSDLNLKTQKRKPVRAIHMYMKIICDMNRK
jgi:hypothetical protein